MTAPRRAAAHPTLLAVIIGGLVLAGAIALFAVLGGAGGSSGATGDRAGGKGAAPTTAAPTTATPTTATPRTTAPATSTPAGTRASAGTSAPATSQAPRSAAKSTPTAGMLPATARRSVTYVVKRGDTLTVIAAWFHQHGYGDLYDRNRAVIGSDPDLILPGQRITISDGRMSVG